MKTKESVGRIFSNLNLISSTKINKKKTSGAKTTIKSTSRTKEKSKFKTIESKILSSDESICGIVSANPIGILDVTNKKITIKDRHFN